MRERITRACLLVGCSLASGGCSGSGGNQRLDGEWTSTNLGALPNLSGYRELSYGFSGDEVTTHLTDQNNRRLTGIAMPYQSRDGVLAYREGDEQFRIDVHGKTLSLTEITSRMWGAEPGTTVDFHKRD
jgi:hypothetical protein